jgi:outer membrane receptor protein involved in Fe transport
MFHRERAYTARLLCSAAASSILVFSGAAYAQEQGGIAIASQPLSKALGEFAAQTKQAVLVTPALTNQKISSPVVGAATPEAALTAMLAGTGLSYRRDGDTFLVVQGGSGPQSDSAERGGAEVEGLIVTAQKREEDIQDVPIAMSAFSQEALERSQIAGGPDLMTQIPNMTFTKTNFTGYSIQIRGIGTQAVSATTDPAVAVAFNNTPFIRNRFFEQEFFDLQRVEVLRGPQGTLYGRNATAGVVNIISAKPKFIYEAKASADLSNYSSKRLEGMVNIPLVEDAVAVRLAGAWTQREGYATNEITGQPIDGRDLWSTRLSLRIAPSDAPFDVNLIWEHFQEDDERLRSGKQLCHKDIVTEVGGRPVTLTQTLLDNGLPQLFSGVQATFSQGCHRGSLYSADAFQTPNGWMLPYYLPLGALSLPTARTDPYASAVQSRDLRVIESTVDPDYRARSDIGELQISFDLTDGIALQSETSYSTDTLSSLQDFNRFNTAPGAWATEVVPGTPNSAFLKGVVDENGVFCDPQLGCSDRLVAVDLSSAKSRQFSQEFRISSDFDAPFNFSLGANYLRYDTEDKYYVFVNSLSLYSATLSAGPYIPGVTDGSACLANGMAPGDPAEAFPVGGCMYIDPNPIGSLNDLGHNYFLSRNPYKLISYAVFGEAYYNVTGDLKITAGLRWTVDKKDAPRILSELLAGGAAGYPISEVVEQDWAEPTGRLAIDWKPDLSFTDETLLYASYAHGYKAGGANPPTFARVYYASGVVANLLNAQSETRPKTFNAEFVDAFELGSKNTLFDGSLTLNLAAFYYDYKDYQISEIVDRSAFNRNFNAEVWGLEIEADWRPVESLKLGFKGGYEKTRIGDGERAIDLMDRTAGRDDWVVVRPFPTQASSCILPAWLFVHDNSVFGLGGVGGGGPGGCELAYAGNFDPVTGRPYELNPTINGTGGTLTRWAAGTYPGWNPLDESVDQHNHGEGFFKDLSGNELPNAPNWTATITADYTKSLRNDWMMTLHTDLHWQSESWWRVFNDHEFNRLDEYFTMNLAAILSSEETGWTVMAYVKNVFDTAAITGAFLNSDDTGLTTNVFLNEPRLYGLRATKAWTGGSLLGSFGGRHDGPYPVTLELGGQIQRSDAPNQIFAPDFLDDFAPEIDPSGKQEEALDWGDSRDLRLTYASQAGWKISLAGRFGEANRGERTLIEGEEFHGCNVAAPCAAEPAQQITVTNYGATQLYDSEEHTVVDFLIGRDLGIGLPALSKSTVSAGLRYAKLESATNVSIYGVPDWYLPAANNLKYPNFSSHHEYDSELEAKRRFEGVGPVVSWEASSRLFGAEELGHLDLDWSVSGGVLFGKQQATGEGSETQAYYRSLWLSAPPVVYPPITTPISFARSEKVTVPTLGLSLGLSYRIGGTSFGAGYRWERYFDAIDGGVEEQKSYDRTIDGPYFKLSVGFGG